MTIKQLWGNIVAQMLEASRTYKAWCKALGRANKSGKNKGLVFRAMNYWRNEFKRLAIVEKSLRGNV